MLCYSNALINELPVLANNKNRRGLDQIRASLVKPTVLQYFSSNAIQQNYRHSFCQQYPNVVILECATLILRFKPAKFTQH